MERDCESELSKLNIEQNACIYHFGASVIHGQRSNILRLRFKFLEMSGFCINKVGLICTSLLWNILEREIFSVNLRSSMIIERLDGSFLRLSRCLINSKNELTC